LSPQQGAVVHDLARGLSRGDGDVVAHGRDAGLAHRPGDAFEHPHVGQSLADEVALLAEQALGEFVSQRGLQWVDRPGVIDDQGRVDLRTSSPVLHLDHPHEVQFVGADHER
jgi:hypothetical protein